MNTLNVFGCVLINFTNDRQTYNLAAHYNRNNTNYFYELPRQVDCKQLMGQRSERQGISKHKQVWCGSDWVNRSARTFTFCSITLTSWTNFCCCSVNVQNTCMLDVWIFLCFINYLAVCMHAFFMFYLYVSLELIKSSCFTLTFLAPDVKQKRRDIDGSCDIRNRKSIFKGIVTGILSNWWFLLVRKNMVSIFCLSK